MTLAFWKWLRRWAQKHEREAFLERHCVDLKCPHCKTWMHAADTFGEFVKIPDLPPEQEGMVTGWKCGHCDHVSGWVCEAGFWFTAKEFFKAMEPVDGH